MPVRQLRMTLLNTGISPQDIREAVLNSGDASGFVSLLRESLGNPPVTSLPSLDAPAQLPETTVFLDGSKIDIRPLLDLWLNGKEYPTSNREKVATSLVAVIPYGRNVSRYLERLIEEINPDMLALDISPLSLRTGMLYSFSLPCAVGLPAYVEVGFPDSRQPFASETFYPGSVEETAILRSWLDKIPLVPVGMPRSPGDSTLKKADEDVHDEEMSGLHLQMAYAEFDESLKDIADSEEIIEERRRIISSLQTSISEHMSHKWQREASYAASRILEIASFLAEQKKSARLLVIADIKRYPSLYKDLNLLWQGLREEVYVPPKSDGVTSAVMLGSHSRELTEQSIQYTPETTIVQEIFKNALAKYSQDRQNEAITLEKADEFISDIALKIREHPEVSGGVSVRGTIGMREVFAGLSEIHGMTLGTLERAALVTLPSRIRLKPQVKSTTEAIVSEVFKEILYGIQFHRRIYQVVPSGKGEWLSSDELNKSLEKLIAENKDESAVVPADREKLLKFLESQGLLQRKQQEFILTRKSIDRLMEGLEQRLMEGSITRDKYELEKKRLEAMLPSPEVEIDIPPKEAAEAIMDFMDAIDIQVEREWGNDINFIRMHAYYELKKDGEEASSKGDYFRLKSLIDGMEKRGFLKAPLTGGDRTLTGAALGFLLDYLEPKDSRLRGLEMAVNASRGKVRERTELIRHYTQGDVFRDISSRHTLREVARQGRDLCDIRQGDFRVFLKHHRRPRSDIVLCIDTSGSMKDFRKLTLTRVIASLLARVAATNNDRVGVVAFDDMGQTTLPLTGEDRGVVNDYIVSLSALGATNIGDGIKCATDLLFKEPDHNRKFIVLITDGEPTAISEKAMSQFKGKKVSNPTEEAALVETRRAASRGVRVSVIHMAEEKKIKDDFVKSIARAGKGKLMVVRVGEEG